MSDQLPEELQNALAAAQAGWQVLSADSDAGRAEATAAALQIMASAEGERGMVNLYLALAQLPGAILAAAGRDPAVHLANMSTDDLWRGLAD